MPKSEKEPQATENITQEEKAEATRRKLEEARVAASSPEALKNRYAQQFRERPAAEAKKAEAAAAKEDEARKAEKHQEELRAQSARNRAEVPSERADVTGREINWRKQDTEDLAFLKEQLGAGLSPEEAQIALEKMQQERLKRQIEEEPVKNAVEEAEERGTRY